MKENTDIKNGNTYQHPPYYNKGKIECWDAIESAIGDLKGMKAFCAGNAIKYIWRFDSKDNSVQDLLKAKQYIDKLIDMEKE